MSLAVIRAVADARRVRWSSLVVLAALASPAVADDDDDDLSYASFALGGGDIGGALESRMGGAGRLRIAAGHREGRFGTEEAFSWDSGPGPEDDERHSIVTYSRSIVKLTKPLDFIEPYARGSLGIAILDGDQVGPSIGFAAGLAVKAHVKSRMVAMFVEVGYDASYFLPEGLDTKFAYLTTGFAFGTSLGNN